MSKLNGWKQALAVPILCAVLVGAGRAQVFTTLANFDGTNGAYPYAAPIQGVDGNFYGTTFGGGAARDCGGKYGCGTVYRLTPTGQLTVLHRFCPRGNCTDGLYPEGSLVQAINGELYSTTTNGGLVTAECGSDGCGTVFEITPAGKLTTLYSFCSQPNCTDGYGPMAGVVQATDGNLYGTTAHGGANSVGTVYEIVPAGTLSTVYSFCSEPNCADGGVPYAGLTEATDGNLYGTTVMGGRYGGGTLFRITPGGKLAILFSFCSADYCILGGGPTAAPAQAANNNLYGTTSSAGYYGGGTVYSIDTAGQLTTLYAFCSQTNCADGSGPWAGLVPATDGNLYGTTVGGGSNGYGEVYEITPEGKPTTLHSFCSDHMSCADGWKPQAGVVQATNGNLYGTTVNGGASTLGTVYSLSVGLGPFVKTLPAAAKVGAEVGILGNNLTGATSVTFNGVLAQFTVRSPTLIVAHVPTAATTGTVQVTLPGGTLSSNLSFYVLK